MKKLLVIAACGFAALACSSQNGEETEQSVTTVADDDDATSGKTDTEKSKAKETDAEGKSATVEDKDTSAIKTAEKQPAPKEKASETDDKKAIDVTMICADGGSTVVEVPGSDEGQIDDEINTIDACEGAGGLESVRFMGCGGRGEVGVSAIDGGLPDLDTLDYCEMEEGSEDFEDASSSGVEIDLVCADGSSSLRTAPVGNVEQVDDYVNETEACELSGGLERVIVPVQCGAQTRKIGLGVSDGSVIDINETEPCE